jgi:hypothetical protein
MSQGKLWITSSHKISLQEKMSFVTICQMIFFNFLEYVFRKCLALIITHVKRIIILNALLSLFYFIFRRNQKTFRFLVIGLEQIIQVKATTLNWKKRSTTQTAAFGYWLVSIIIFSFICRSFRGTCTQICTTSIMAFLSPILKKIKPCLPF